MPLRDELLTPIDGPNPGGSALRYDPLYDKIKEARREDEDIPQGEWQIARKTADWPLVIKLTKEALATRSKDLQLAVWLAEAMLRREGFAGFRSALDTIGGLLEQQWEYLYPEIDDGDMEMRAAPLDWLGMKLDLAARRVPLDRSGHDWLQHQAARMVPTELEAAGDEAKSESRNALIAEGKTTPEDIERGFQATTKAWLKSLVADIDGTLEMLQNLDDLSQERFGKAAPSYSKLVEAIEDVQRTAKQLLKRKLEIDPDPVEGTTARRSSGAVVSIPDGVVLPGSVGGQLSAQPTSREDAAARIASAARFLRQNDPTNPASYLLLRGFRWGELRASGKTTDPRLLEAPTTQTRTQLKTLLLDAKWDALLDACEGVMAMPHGRGWLDLQRYALTACVELGSEYRIVAEAISGALRSLLADLPQLVDMTLMDDTPTANAETRNWLKGVIQIDERRGEDHAARDGSDGSGDVALPRARDGRAAAMAEVRAGRTDRAIGLLMREAAAEKSQRGRFLVQTQLASVMVEAGHHPVAQPILEELLTYVETHKLEDWEAGDVVARPLALLYRCLERSESDPIAKQALYLRICRLDPLQAIGFTQS